MIRMKNYKDVETEEELKTYLKERAKMLTNTSDGEDKYVYQYTMDDTIIKILESRKWYLGSPRNMNDGVENDFISTISSSENLFFASFLEEEHENVAMWSMYGQPWDKGVAIRIPLSYFKKWISSDAKIYQANQKKEVIKEIKRSDYELNYHKVAYTKLAGTPMSVYDVINCGGKKITNLRDSKTHFSSTIAGYIKDYVWSYENELRVMVSLNVPSNAYGLLVEIPDDIIANLKFVTGPKYSDDLLSIIRSKVDSSFDPKRIQPSTFTGRLNWVYCDSCPFTKKNEEKK